MKIIKHFNLWQLFQSRKKEIFLLLTTLIIFSLIIVIFFEIKLRKEYNKFHDKMELKYKGREICTTYSDNPKLIYELKSNTCDTNSHGFKDYEYNYTKQEGIFRIVIVGDSVAQGQGVDFFEESFGKILEKKLNNLSRNTKFEVIVLAVTGYSTSQELILLEDTAFKYNPDIVIWSYVMNDPAHPVHHNVNGELGRYFFKPKSYFIHYISSKIFSVNERLKSKNCDRELHKFLHCVYWDEVQSNIKKIGDLSSKKNTPIIFLIHPIFEKESYEKYSLTNSHEKLYNEALKNNLIVYDILEEFKKYNINDIKQHNLEQYDPWHPNAKGHKIIAEYLYNELVNYLNKLNRISDTKINLK